MKKIVLKVDLHDLKDKQKAMKAVATFSGIDSIGVDMTDNKMTVIGEADPVEIAVKLRKLYHTDIVTVGPVEEPEKKKEEPKKEQVKKEEEKKEGPSDPIGYPYWTHHQHVNVFTIEDYPNDVCVIC